MVNTAKREFARTLPGRPMDDQSVRMQNDEEISTLRRENSELRAEMATLRGGGVAPLNRAPRMITVPEEALGSLPAPPVATVEEPTAVGMSPRSTPPEVAPPPAFAPPKSATPARPAAARTHAVASKDTLYGISVKYFGNGRQVEAIYQANRDVMKDRTDLRPGMVLKIPAPETASAPRK